MRAAFHTLGCKVNQYETEVLREQFRAAGYEIVDWGQEADVFVINTCTVTNLADRKSRQMIRQAHRRNPNALVAVTGCYAQVHPEDVAELPGVTVICGNGRKSTILQEVEEAIKTKKNDTQVRVEVQGDLTSFEEMGHIAEMGNRSRAFIKIQEGCDRYCSYCIIPYARGGIRSREEEEILREFRGLLEQGFKEIVLTGINTALYGRERDSAGREGASMERLIGRMNDLPGDFRIRLSSLEPTVVDKTYVRRLLRFDKLCHHLHLSIQSGSDRILKAMNRRYDRKGYLEILEILRAHDPFYGITTDIIAGFPGEREEDLEESLDMVRQASFSKVHVFRYSPREGTVAASRQDQVPGMLKTERAARLMEQAEKTAEVFFKRCRGQIRRVLIEGFQEDGTPVGYTDNYIKVCLPGQQAAFNTFYDVVLLDKYEDGMTGEIAGSRERR